MASEEGMMYKAILFLILVAVMATLGVSAQSCANAQVESTCDKIAGMISSPTQAWAAAQIFRGCEFFDAAPEVFSGLQTQPVLRSDACLARSTSNLVVSYEGGQPSFEVAVSDGADFLEGEYAQIYVNGVADFLRYDEGRPVEGWRAQGNGQLFQIIACPPGLVVIQ